MTPADSRRIRLVSDAVVASYIHEISARAGSGDAPAPARRHGDRLAHARRALRRREDLVHDLRPSEAAHGMMPLQIASVRTRR